MEALKLLPERAGAAPPAAPTDTDPEAGWADGNARIHGALSRLLAMMGFGAQEGGRAGGREKEELVLKPFAKGEEAAAAEVGEAEGGAAAGASAGNKVLVLDGEANLWVARNAAALRVGDVVKVVKMQTFPADLLLLHASSPTEVREGLGRGEGLLKGLGFREKVCCCLTIYLNPKP